jgi:hypothetical protein
MNVRTVTPLSLLFGAAVLLSMVGVAPRGWAEQRLPASGGGAAGGGRPVVGFGTTQPVARPAGDPRLSAFDPQTRLLIEVELRDASPSEREQWLNLLSGVEVDQIPHLLEARRKAAAGRAREQDSSSRGAASGPGSSPSSSAGAGPTAGYRRGLGGTSAATSDSSRTTSGDRPGWTTLRPIGAFGPGETPRGATADTLLEAERPSPEEPPTSARETPPEPSAAPRRSWIPPLRPRWGEGGRETAATPVEEPASPPPPDITPPASVESRSSAYMNVELQRVMALLRTEIEHSAESGSGLTKQERLQRQVQLRLLHLLADEPQLALQAIPDLPEAEQEFWMQMLWALQSGLRPPAGSPRGDHWNTTADLLAAAQRRARELAPLHIRHACFCHRINNFGNYETFPRDEFRPGQPVLVYAEIQNFRSELAGPLGYRSRLRTALEILPGSETGGAATGATPMERRDFPATEDLCRSERTDYFHSYRLDLPPQLSPGRYVLRLTITDELSGQSAAAELPFRIP